MVAGCGGAHPRGLSRRQLIRHAQPICLRAQAAAGAMLPPPRQAGLAGTASYFQESAAIAQARTDDLRALRVRPGTRLAAKWNRLIAAEEAFTARLASLGAAAASGDVRRLARVEADTVPEQALIGGAAKLGVPLCAP